jgi:ZIP family zinc transporter
VFDAFVQGFVASASLLVGAVFAIRHPIGRRALGLVMAFGSGMLISAVAYELVGEAFLTSAGEGGVALGLVCGSLTFFVGDVLVDRIGSNGDDDGEAGSGNALAVVLGTVLDGIPESIVLGVGIATVSDTGVAMFVAVFMSNLPEAMSSTAGLRTAGWSTRSLLLMWTGIVVASGLAAAVGYAVFGDASASTLAFVLAFAGGAVLTMLADTMMPDAFADSGRFTGVVTTLAFGAGFILATL